MCAQADGVAFDVLKMLQSLQGFFLYIYIPVFVVFTTSEVDIF